MQAVAISGGMIIDGDTKQHDQVDCHGRQQVAVISHRREHMSHMKGARRAAGRAQSAHQTCNTRTQMCNTPNTSTREPRSTDDDGMMRHAMPWR